jgi:hypothetical protein
MIGLLWQTCDIKRRDKASAGADGQVVYNTSDTVVASTVPCRLDDSISKMRTTQELSKPISFAEEVHGTIYLYPDSNIDEGDYLIISGDSRTWEIIGIRKSPDFGGLHHLELEVRTFTHI